MGCAIKQTLGVRYLNLTSTSCYCSVTLGLFIGPLYVSIIICKMVLIGQLWGWIEYHVLNCVRMVLGTWSALNISCYHYYICICCCSVAKSCLTLCDPMDSSIPGFPVLYHLPEFAQTHVHWVSNAIQPSHPLSLPSPPAFNLSQHRGFFPMSQLSTSGGQSIGASASASILPMNIQGWAPLGLTGWISLLSI